MSMHQIFRKKYDLSTQKGIDDFCNYIYPIILCYCQQFTSNEDDAYDLAQKIMLELLENDAKLLKVTYNRYIQSIALLKSFLKQRAEWRFKDFYNAKKKRKSLEQEYTEPEIDESEETDLYDYSNISVNKTRNGGESLENQLVLENIITVWMEKIATRRQKVVFIRLQQGYSPKEIAKELNISEAAVSAMKVKIVESLAILVPHLRPPRKRPKT